MKVQVGELYWVDFPYQDSEESEIRPAIIVLREIKGKVVCVKVTGSCWRKEKNDFVIMDWKQAGLTKESLAEMKRMEIVELKKLHEKIGKLTNKDKKRLFKAMKEV